MRTVHSGKNMTHYYFLSWAETFCLRSTKISGNPESYRCLSLPFVSFPMLINWVIEISTVYLFYLFFLRKMLTQLASIAEDLWNDLYENMAHPISAVTNFWVRPTVKLYFFSYFFSLNFHCFSVFNVPARSIRATTLSWLRLRPIS